MWEEAATASCWWGEVGARLRGVSSATAPED